MTGEVPSSFHRDPCLVPAYALSDSIKNRPHLSASELMLLDKKISKAWLRAAGCVESEAIALPADDMPADETLVELGFYDETAVNLDTEVKNVVSETNIL